MDFCACSSTSAQMQQLKQAAAASAAMQGEEAHLLKFSINHSCTERGRYCKEWCPFTTIACTVADEKRSKKSG
jgi:hypothetical protein